MYNHLLNPFARGLFGGRKPRVIAHRGSSGTHPENTLVSFAQGVADGADILEMDVRLTADGAIVVLHDATVDRTSDGTGPVSAMTLAQVRSLDAGYRFSPDGGKTFPFRGKGIVIPTFEEVLEAFPTMPLNVELKAQDPVLVSKFVQALNRHKRFENVMVLIAAEPSELMGLIRSEDPRVVTGHSYWEVLRFLVLSKLGLGRFFKPKAPAMQIPARKGRLQVATPGFVRSAHRLGMEVHVWTINEEEHMRILLSMGVDGLFTDFPGRMRRLVDSGDWKPKARVGGR